MLLIFFAAIPGGILTFSCTYMCGCSRFVFVGEDGHMRLHCCGKAVTGIGKILKLISTDCNQMNANEHLHYLSQ